MTIIIVSPLVFLTAEVISTYKKDKSIEKTNCRSISIISNISKIYKRLTHENMNDYFSDALSKFQCGFRKSFSAQNYVLYMIETI